MGDGVVMQCTRVDRMRRDQTLAGTTEAVCCGCRQRVWLSKPSIQLVRSTEGIKPYCDVCKPAAPVGYIKPDKISGE